MPLCSTCAARAQQYKHLLDWSTCTSDHAHTRNNHTHCIVGMKSWRSGLCVFSLVCLAVILMIYEGPWLKNSAKQIPFFSPVSVQEHLWVDKQMPFSPGTGSPTVYEDNSTTLMPFFGPGSQISGGCGKEPLHIVVLVMTLPTSLKARKAIRETWMKAYDQTQVSLTLRFVAGTHSIQTNISRSLLNEHKKHGDLLLMDKLKEAYSNLPLKVMMGLRWASDNLNFDYLVKTDDDMYLRIDVLSQGLQKMNCEKMLYWGQFFAGVPIRYKHRNREKNWLLCRHYFPYAAGGGYVLAEKVIKSALPTSERVIFYSNEDVTVGSMLVPFNIKRMHDSRFITHGVRCINDFVLLNVEKHERLYEIQSRLSRSEEFCESDKATTGEIFRVEYQHLPSLHS